MLASAKTTRDPGTESGACRLVRIPPFRARTRLSGCTQGQPHFNAWGARLAISCGARDMRLCNSYLKSDQEMLGTAMAFLAGALAVGWGIGLFFGPARPSIAGDVPPAPSVLPATSGAQSLS